LIENVLKVANKRMNNKDVEAALQSGLIIEMIDLIKRTPID
jgi:hypothetical protein